MPKAVTILIYLLAEVEVINNQLAPKLRFFVILMSSTNVTLLLLTGLINLLTQSAY